MEEVPMPTDPEPDKLAGFDFKSYNEAVFSEHNVSAEFDLSIQAKEFMDNKAMMALRQIAYLAEHSQTEKLRLDAAKWIAEHTVYGANEKLNSTERTLAMLLQDTTSKLKQTENKA
jgi:hypothetical protein